MITTFLNLFYFHGEYCQALTQSWCLGIFTIFENFFCLTSDYLLSENFLRDEKGSRFILLPIASISHWKSLRYADFLLRRILKEDPSDLDGYQVFSVSDLEHFIHP